MIIAHCHCLVFFSRLLWLLPVATKHLHYILFQIFCHKRRICITLTYISKLTVLMRSFTQANTVYPPNRWRTCIMPRKHSGVARNFMDQRHPLSVLCITKWWPLCLKTGFQLHFQIDPTSLTLHQ